MRKSKTLAKLRSGKVARACALGHFHPPFVTLAADAGYDCIWLDLEHRAMEQREVQALLAFCHLADIDCMVRARSRESVPLYRYLEDGATGLMINMLDTAEDARRVVQALKFPPIGNRGFDGAGLDCRFSLDADESFTDDANRETFIMGQIETPRALENIEELAAVDGIDILLVGPGDMGLRLSKCGGPVPDVEAAMQSVAEVVAAHQKAFGVIAVGRELMQKRYDQGARFIINANEFVAIRDALRRNAEEFRELSGD